MKNAIVAVAVAAALCGPLAAADQNEVTASELLAMERQGMEGWRTGDPDPALAVLDPEVTYFHAVTNHRLDGLPAVKALFEDYRGTPLFDSYEIAEPKVQANGDTAVLTYILVRRNGMATTRWNATQVYLHKNEGWRVIHSHWSAIQPPRP